MLTPIVTKAWPLTFITSHIVFMLLIKNSLLPAGLGMIGEDLLEVVRRRGSGEMHGWEQT
jgi:hypothetical protein